MKIVIENIEFDSATLCMGNTEEDCLIRYNIDAKLQFSDGKKFSGTFSFDADKFDNPSISDFENAIKELLKEK
jgi:hypothetical protein